MVVALAFVWTAAGLVAWTQNPSGPEKAIVAEQIRKVFLPGLGEGARFGDAVEFRESAGESTAFVVGSASHAYGFRMSHERSLAVESTGELPNAAALAVPPRSLVRGRIRIVSVPDERMPDGVSTGVVRIEDAATSALLARITKPVSEALVRFGNVIAIDGDILVVTAKRAHDRHGVAFVFDIHDPSRPIAGPALHPYDNADDLHAFASSVAIRRIRQNFRGADLYAVLVSDPTDNEGPLHAGGATYVFRVVRTTRGEPRPLTWLSMIGIFGGLAGIGAWSASRKRTEISESTPQSLA